MTEGTGRFNLADWEGKSGLEEVWIGANPPLRARRGGDDTMRGESQAGHAWLIVAGSHLRVTTALASERIRSQ